MCNNFSLFIEIDIHFLITRVPPDSTKATRYAAIMYVCMPQITNFPTIANCINLEIRSNGMGQNKLKSQRLKRNFQCFSRF